MKDEYMVGIGRPKKNIWKKSENGLGRPAKPIHENRNILWNKVKKEKKCWIWQGATSLNNKGKPQGVISNCGQRYLAHRLAWEFRRGVIPPGFWISQRCGKSLCVRPDHLQLESLLPRLKAERILKRFGSNGNR